MRFPKGTREALHESAGKPVEIDWPAGPVEPVPGRHYSVQSSQRAAELQILVLFVDERPEGWRAIVRLHEPARLLGKSGGYVSSTKGAMATRTSIEPAPLGGPQFRPEFEPEAVSEAEQRQITREAHARQRDRIREAIDRAESEVARLEEIPEFQASRSAIHFQRGLLRKLEAELLASLGRAA
jgi:hypothetical protein